MGYIHIYHSQCHAVEQSRAAQLEWIHLPLLLRHSIRRSELMGKLPG